MRRSKLGSEEEGFTLVEVLVAALILVVGVMGTVALIDGANATTTRNKQRVAASNLMRDVLEAAHNVEYLKLSSGSLIAELSEQAGIADNPADGYTLTRRGTAFTITGTVCAVDDPKDGTGSTASNAAFCSSSAGTQDRNPDDYKRVTLTITWGGGEPARTLRQTTIVNNPGASTGPRIVTMAMTGPVAPPTVVTESSCGTQPQACTATFAVTTSFPPATVAWYVDGEHYGSLTGAGTSYTFSWPISTVPDGAYQVTTQAFDANGVAGISKVVTVKINRGPPAAPTGLLGGRNGSVVDLEWSPNSERDVIGYRAYRQVGSDPAVLVGACNLVQKPECTDTSPPADPEVKYWVTAVDLHPVSNSPRDGALSAPVTVTTANDPPYPPTAVIASPDPIGIKLAWTAASPDLDPNAGDTIAYYRIYRDGETIAHRYNRTGSAAELTFLDEDTGGTSHTYWVSAVDDHLAESPLVPAQPAQ